MRVVLDVNVLVSAVIAPQGTPRLVLNAWEAGRFEVIISESISTETREKLRDRRIGGKYGATDEDIRWMMTLLMTQAEKVTLATRDIAVVTGDPEDDSVLATCVVGQADTLVTGDKRLLALVEYKGIKIISPRRFLDNF